MHSAPPTPAEHHYTEAEQGLAQLALLGLDDLKRSSRSSSRSPTPRLLPPRDYHELGGSPVVATDA